MGSLKITGVRILNEETPEFFKELCEKGVDAIVEVPDLWSPCCYNSLCKFTHRRDNEYQCVKCGNKHIIRNLNLKRGSK